MPNLFKSIEQKIKDFFRRQQWKEIFTFLFFVLLSFGFWLLQNLRQDCERKFDLLIKYSSVPSGLVLSENNPKVLHLVLKDKGTTLLYYSWRANFTPIDISVSELISSSKDSSVCITHKMLETAVFKQLISSTSIVSIDPREIVLKYNSLVSRRLPVVANVTVQAQPGFQISDSIIIEPSKVLVYANRDVLDTLKCIKTKLVTIENANKTKEVTTRLQLPNGVKVEPETVKLIIPIEEYTEKKVYKSIICNDIPADYALRIFPSDVEVTYSVPLSHFKDIKDEDIEISVPFKEFEANQSNGKISVTLTKKPLWITNPVIVPDEVEFIIEQIKHD